MQIVKRKLLLVMWWSLLAGGAVGGWLVAANLAAENRRLHEEAETFAREKAGLEARLKPAGGRGRNAGRAAAPLMPPPPAAEQSAAAAPAPDAPEAGNPPARNPRNTPAFTDQAIAPAPDASADRNSMRRRMQENWEKFKQENPEEYTRIEEERRQRRLDMANTTRSRLDFLAAIPTDGLSEDYLKNHEAVLERVRFFAAATEQMAADPESEASRELRRQMFENSRGLGEMLTKEREIIYSDLAHEMGLRGEEATEFIGYLNYVNTVTSPQDFRRHRGQPRPGPPPPAAAPPAANQ